MAVKKFSLTELDEHYRMANERLIGYDNLLHDGKHVYGVRGTSETLDRTVIDLSVHSIPDDLGVTYLIPIPSER